MLAVAVAVAGAAGAIARSVVDGTVQTWTGSKFPAGTFVVNVSGAFAFGVLGGFLFAHSEASTELGVVAGTGFVGAYTTFSALAFETFRLARTGAIGFAILDLAGSAVTGLAVAWIGSRLGMRL